jgi:hypothetical protein
MRTMRSRRPETTPCSVIPQNADRARMAMTAAPRTARSGHKLGTTSWSRAVASQRVRRTRAAALPAMARPRPPDAERPRRRGFAAGRGLVGCSSVSLMMIPSRAMRAALAAELPCSRRSIGNGSPTASPTLADPGGDALAQFLGHHLRYAAIWGKTSPSPPTRALDRRRVGARFRHS